MNEGRQIEKIGHFQRLELIGDAVIGLVVKQILFEAHPSWGPGELTSESSKYINNKGPLCRVARNLGLDKMLIVGHGEELLHVEENTKVLSDALEALFGAIFIDNEDDYRAIKKLVLKHWQPLGLLQKKFPPTEEQNKLDNDLIKAIINNNENSVQELLTLGADPNTVVLDPPSTGNIIDLSGYPNRLSLLQFATHRLVLNRYHKIFIDTWR